MRKILEKNINWENNNGCLLALDARGCPARAGTRQIYIEAELNIGTDKK